jgi:hypothetical protein
VHTHPDERPARYEPEIFDQLSRRGLEAWIDVRAHEPSLAWAASRTRILVVVTREVEALLAALDDERAGVLKKLAGLTEADARRSTVPSGTNLAGLLQHLTFVEAKWFEAIVGGRSPSRGQRSMEVDASISVKALRADYRAACEASNEIIRSLGDADAPVTYDGKTRDLRWAILAVIGETARHAGHADILREQIDGKTGR